MSPEYNYDRIQSGEQHIPTGELLEHMAIAIRDLRNLAIRMGKDVEIMKGDMRNILRKLDDMEGSWEPQETEEMSVDEIKKLILDEVGVDKPFYPSDVALKHNLDYDAVLEAVEALRRDGRIRE